MFYEFTNVQQLHVFVMQQEGSRCNSDSDDISAISPTHRDKYLQQQEKAGRIKKQKEEVEMKEGGVVER